MSGPVVVPAFPKGAEQAVGAGGYGRRRRQWDRAIFNEGSYYLPYCEAVMAELQTRMRSIQVPNTSFSTQSNEDTIKDGTEDANHNGKIDGDNGDGKYQDTETWTETNPNSWDTDQDSIRDQIEKQYGYNPLSDDTDSDGLNDTQEDKNSNGNLDAGETDPLEMDSDGDGLLDPQELNGWTVVITYEATGEIKEKTEVTSNPRKIDSDSDGLTDYQEYTNATNPNKSDSDGDGKTDEEEIEGDFNSTATGIDGEPPEIWQFECYYEEKYADLGLIKIPSGGLKVKVKVGVKDIFGISYINIAIRGLEDRRYNTGNIQNISHTFEWSISSVDQYKRVLFKGFKINVSAKDRNGNIGFKKDDLPSISKMLVDFFIGSMKAISKFIKDLVSGIFTWIYDTVSNMINGIIQQIVKIKNEILNGIYSAIDPFVNYINTGMTDDSLLMDGINKLFSILFNSVFAIVVTSLFTAINVIAIIVAGVSFGTTEIVLLIIDLIITLISVLLLVSNKNEDEPLFNIPKFFNSFLGIKVDTSESSKGGFMDIIGNIMVVALTICSYILIYFSSLELGGLLSSLNGGDPSQFKWTGKSIGLFLLGLIFSLISIFFSIVALDSLNQAIQYKDNSNQMANSNYDLSKTRMIICLTISAIALFLAFITNLYSIIIKCASGIGKTINNVLTATSFGTIIFIGLSAAILL